MCAVVNSEIGRGAQQVIRMEWPSAAAVADAVIVRQDPSSASRFVVHGSDGAQLACATYAEAEAHAASYAARANVWYLERGRLQLVCSFSTCRPRREMPVPNSDE